MAQTSLTLIDSNGRPLRPAARQTARYLRDTRSGVIGSRVAPLSFHRDDVRRSWTRASALAMDIMQNSGRIRGAADQVIADTIGTELIYNPQPDLTGLGYDDKEKKDFIVLLKNRWKQWAWNPRECDQRGKMTIQQMLGIGLRHDLVFGEITGVLTYMSRAERRRYGITTGTKVLLLPPQRLVQDTSEVEGLFQGVIHDAAGRPVAYRFRERQSGIEVKRDWPAHDAEGRPIVIHVFDPQDAEDVRGISRLAAAFRKHLSHEIAEDTTLQTFILQTMFAATLTSAAPSAEAFEALEALKEVDNGSELYDDFMGLLNAQMTRAKESDLAVDGSPQVSHLAPGEQFQMHSSGTPGPSYAPFTASLSRDMARVIGVTYGAFTLDYTNATYSSNQMENASVWPVVLRRRETMAAPVAQAIVEAWLDEEIGEGRIQFKGGPAAFAANRKRVSWAQWLGPAKPSADDGKSAKAASERLANGTSTLEAEVAAIGGDPNEVFETRLREHQRYVAAGMPSPYVRGFNLPAGDLAEPEVKPETERSQA